ncbi:hypothetical protein GGS24DRAFT_517069 [Hypoxylon argillaceum]|nr:hypothetical protein GGS24DRAFT_517069 [Hypoxylon argillaceum]
MFIEADSVILRRSEPLMQTLETEKILDKFYTHDLGVSEAKMHLDTVIDYLMHHYPRMIILELRASTGDFTSAILQRLGSSLDGYTFTDLSFTGFEATRNGFASHDRYMSFQVLDIERSPIDQESKANSYDLIMAARILNSAKSPN